MLFWKSEISFINFFLSSLLKCGQSLALNLLIKFYRTKCQKWWYKFTNKLYSFFNLQLYIMMITETMILLLVVSIFELSKLFVLTFWFNFTKIEKRFYKGNTNNTTVTSFSISCAIFIGIGWFAILNLWIWCKSKKPEEYVKISYFKYFISSYKNKMVWKIYTVLFTVKRTLLVGIAIYFLDSGTNNFIKVGVFLLPHVLDTVFLVVYKPFKHTKENVWEIINAICFIFVMIFYLVFKYSNDWTTVIIWWYLGLIMFDNMLYSVISMIFACIECKKKKQSKVKAKMKEIHAEEVNVDADVVRSFAILEIYLCRFITVWKILLYFDIDVTLNILC